MIRHKRLAYVALNVKDVRKSAQYYKDIVGLMITEEVSDSTAFLTCGDDHHSVVLYQSNTPGVKRIAFELEDEMEFEKGYEYLCQRGIAVQELTREECKELALDKAYRFSDPNGFVIEYFHNMEQHAERFVPYPIKILRLGHVLIPTDDFPTTHSFYKDVLNFKVSDYKFGNSGEIEFAFMRCFPNPYHHSFAIGPTGKKDYCHVAFMVTDIDDIGRGKNKLEKNEIKIGNGPGRHAASGSIFLYWKDPDGIMLEYTLGMEEFTEVNPRKPRLLDNTPQSSNIWLV